MLRWICGFLLLCFAWCSWAQATERYIAPSDTVHLTCEEEPGLTGEYKITRDGLIILKFVGAIKVSGLTCREAALKVRDQLLLHRVLSQATITMSFDVAAPPGKPVTFEGAVKVASSLPFKEKMTVGDVIKVAEPTPSADLSKIEITGSDQKTRIVNYPTENPELKPGDRVFFPIQVKRTGTVTVLGGVARPGVLTWDEGMTVRSAILKSGGFDGLGNSTKVRIERGNEAPRLLDLSNDKVDEALQPNDRIVVELNPVRRYISVVGQVVRQGTMEFRDAMTLTTAIRDAGGLLPNTKVKEVRIYEAAPKGKGKLKGVYDLQRILDGYLGDVKLVPGDQIEVGKVGKRSSLPLSAAA